MTQSKDIVTSPQPKHRVLREVLRHYLEFRDFISQHGGDGVIEHSYWVWDPDDPENPDKRTKQTITVSFWDLFTGLSELAPRKKEAVWHNVIQDKLQREVADIMNITTVSVGQYVEHAMIQLAERYFAEEEDSQTSVRDQRTPDDADADIGIHTSRAA